MELNLLLEDQQHSTGTALMPCGVDHLPEEAGHLLEGDHRHLGDHYQEVQVGQGREGDWSPWISRIAGGQMEWCLCLVAKELSAVAEGLLSSPHETRELEAIVAHPVGTRTSMYCIGI